MSKQIIKILTKTELKLLFSFGNKIIELDGKEIDETDLIQDTYKLIFYDPTIFLYELES